MNDIVEFVTTKLSEEGKGLSEDELKALAQKYAEEAISQSGAELSEDDLEQIAGGLSQTSGRGGVTQAASLVASTAFTEFSTGRSWR